MRASMSKIWLTSVLSGAVALWGRGAAAQQLSACYVPTVGAVYLVGQPNLPGACLAQAHVPITLGTGTIADGAVTGAKLANDPGSLAKVSGGVMTSTNGNVSIGQYQAAARFEVFTAGSAISGTATGPGFPVGVAGVSTAYGLYGASSGATGVGIRGENTSTTGFNYGVIGAVYSPDGIGVYGQSAITGSTTGVRGLTSSPSGVGVEGRALAATGAPIGVLGIVASSGGTAGMFAAPPTGALLRGLEDGVSGERFRVEASGNVFADGSYNCGLASACFNTGIGADVAERIDASERLEPGDVVEIDTVPATFRRARDAYSTRVAGIVATAPAITLGNNDLTGNDSGRRTDQRPLLALVGRVPVNVTAEGGPIAVGDLLTSSGTPGHAMRCAERSRCAGAIVGKALEPWHEGTGRILALVTLH